VPHISPVPPPPQFSNTLSQCFNLKREDQVLHPYKTTGKLTVCIF
jgi:hypothetical protein